MRLLLMVILTLTNTPPAHGPGASGSAGRTHTVTIDASRFAPATLSVAPGDTVIWKNNDLFPHTATSRTGAFDSKDIAPGKTWKYVVPKKGRLFEYFCVLHPTMQGALRVK